MKYRIAIWASAGFLVACFWALYAAMAPVPMNSTEPIAWTLAGISEPIVLAGFHFHVGLHFSWVLLANAATYALIGLLVETLRHKME